MALITQLGDWAFCPEKLLLWRASMPEKEVFSAIQRMPDVDGLRKAREVLGDLDWHNVPINTFQISRAGICIAKCCQLRCRYCSECSTEGNGRELPNEDVLRFVNDLIAKSIARGMLQGTEPSLKVIFTGGGEPTYEFNKFADLVRKIRALGETNGIKLILDITTNGAYDLERSEFIAKHFDSVMISYDGLPDIQDRNRPSPHFQSTSAVVEPVIKAMCGRAGKLVIRTTISPHDIPRLQDMADHVFGKFGIDLTWSVFPVTPKGRASKSDIARFEGCDFYREFSRVRQYALERYGKVDMTSPLFFTHENDFYCGSLGFLTRVAWLRADGRIVTCLEMGEDETVIGHLEQGVVSYKESCADPLVRITQRKFEECRKCIAFPFCRGGCPADHRASERAGVQGESWACRQTIAFWKDRLIRIAAGERGLGWRIEPIKGPASSPSAFCKLVKEEI